MQSIAIVTSSEHPLIAKDDIVLCEAFQKIKIKCVPAPWDDGTIDWNKFDAVLVRSCWNYHKKPDQFVTWLTALENIQANVINPVDTIKWNINKSYLRELSGNGVNIPPTEWLQAGSIGQDNFLLSILKRNNWKKAVVKPAVSASAFHTIAFTEASCRETESHLKAQRGAFRNGILVQQFIDHIPSHGELSFIFIGRSFSHAVLKTSRSGDFRVQSEYGGKVSSFTPDERALEAVDQLLMRIDKPFAFARVDCFFSEDTFFLIELELIEPVLFFGNHEKAAGQLAQHVAGNLN